MKIKQNLSDKPVSEELKVFGYSTVGTDNDIKVTLDFSRTYACYLFGGTTFLPIRMVKVGRCFYCSMDSILTLYVANFLSHICTVNLLFLEMKR